ncbi:hypothetical protein L195_g041252 [Trifolium pratense]|uniref:Uncharacterized protein n=1 Tax=Trifolium pratense TaxID=57577 RepID=A0A2K3M306_TRIPR|nr:hypothetical protein L195_g041252 [Trifolium pratense]
MAKYRIQQIILILAAAVLVMQTTARKGPGITNDDGRKYRLVLPCCIGQGCPFPPLRTPPPPPPMSHEEDHANAMMANAAAAPTSHMDK